jgi:hypothetical protein
MRLLAGRIWSVPHFTERDKEPYEELSKSLQNEDCTPILGPALLEPIWGMPYVVARDWAERRGFPLASYRSDELASVAQYLARRRTGKADRAFVVNTWLETVEGLINKEWPGLAGGIKGLEHLLPAQRVALLARAAGVELRRRDKGGDAFSLLARLPVRVYLTATPDPLLADALKAVGREPIVEYARWTDALKREPRAFDEDDKGQAVVDRQHPLVFHLFGRLEERDSLVVTEDDFFDYLIYVVKEEKAIPSLVRKAWSHDALILLGFDLDDWTFRALYRAIVNEEGHLHRRMQGPLSAAVQLTPEEDRHLRPHSALLFLEQVFNSESISLSWSEPQDFLREVWERLPPAFGGPP